MTRHRLFPAIVALWFAALLGLGSLAVPPSLLSQAVSASRLPELVPAAAPPLGFTAQALVALVLTALGGLVGLLVGRRIGRHGETSQSTSRAVSPVPTVRARDSHPDAPPRQPFSASEHLVPEDRPEKAEVTYPGRRRALSVTDETQPAEHRDFAPVPGESEVMPLDLSALFAEIESEGAATGDPALSPADEIPERAEPAAEDVATAEPVPSLPAEVRSKAAPVLADRPSPALVTAASLPVQALPSASPVAAAPLESLGVVQLVERLALAIGDHRQRHPGSGAPDGFAEALRALGTDAAPPRAASEPVVAVPDAPAAASTPPEPVIARFERPAPVVSLPLGPLPVHAESEEGEVGLPAQAARFLRREPQADGAPVVPADAEDEILSAEEPVAAADYSSLLRVPVMRHAEGQDDLAAAAAEPDPAPATRQMFVRIDEPVGTPAGSEPVVIFPGHAAAPAQSESSAKLLVSGPSKLDREEADRALRAALATLQRMSGAR